jgi:hypothetical protein
MNDAPADKKNAEKSPQIEAARIAWMAASDSKRRKKTRLPLTHQFQESEQS